jgi:hypothetical protein
MYNLYSVLKTFEHNVLLARWFHPLSPALLCIKVWVRTSPPALLSLTFYPHGLTGWSYGPLAWSLAGPC